MAYVPYTGADENVDLGTFNLNANAIGIGTTITSFALDVTGDVHFSDNLTLDGTGTFSGVSVNGAPFLFGEVITASQTYSATTGSAVVADFEGTQSVGTTGTLEALSSTAHITNTSGTVANATSHIAVINKSGAGTLTQGSTYTAVFVSSGGTTTSYNGYHVSAPNLSGGAVLTNNHAFISEIGAGDLHIGDSGFIGGAVRFGHYGAGTATFDASGNITSVSDEQLKNIQGSYKAGLAEILKLNPIIYKWKPGHNMETEHDYAGFSAQNVRDNIPLGTGISGEGYLSLQDRAIQAALVNSVKELEAEIVKLKKQMNKNQK